MAKRQNARQNSKTSGRKPQRKQSPRYTAQGVLALIAAESGPVTWRHLTELADADHARAITQLRQMLKGLQRSGELERDHQGAYHIPGEVPAATIIVTRRGKQFYAGSAHIEEAQRFDLREGDAVEVRIIGENARVLRVISHADTPVTGILRRHSRYPYVDGIGSYRGRVSLLETPQIGADGDTVRVKIVDRDRRGLVGVVVDLVDSDSVLDQAIATAVSSAGLPDVWPAAVESAANKLPKSVTPSRFPKRRDLTDVPLVTIDGITAKDFDDAVFAQTLSRGRGFRLIVAIADVAHYVKRGSALDEEAQARSTSVYFPERVIPMLPEALSNGLCSLRPETPRLALACEMRIDRKGQLKSYEFSEALIYSHARLTYEEVQAHLDEQTPLPVADSRAAAVTTSIATLAHLYDAMRMAREQRGALDFATREANLVVQGGHVTALQPVRRLLAHQLIEEAMIAANVAAASFLEDHKTPALYRVHEPPDVDKLEELRQALAHAGVRLAPGDVTPAAMQHALSNLPDHADDWLYSQLALRTLQQARYTPNNQGHFGLALERYMHFTSPIRRYPDLVVHRAIKAVLARLQKRPGKAIPGMDELTQLGEQCSSFERRAESAGWLVDAWLKCDFLLDSIGETMPGVIAGVTEFGLFVELDDYFVQGLLHISNLGQDYFHFEARSFALVGERSGRRFGLGDRLDVVIRDIEPPQGKIDLRLADKQSSKAKQSDRGSSKPTQHKRRSNTGKSKTDTSKAKAKTHRGDASGAESGGKSADKSSRKPRGKSTGKKSRGKKTGSTKSTKAKGRASKSVANKGSSKR